MEQSIYTPSKVPVLERIRRNQAREKKNNEITRIKWQ